MSDLSYPLPWSVDNLPQVSWTNLKLCDNGDGTFAVATRDMPLSAANITTATTTLVKSGAGMLKRLVFNKLISLATCTIYDSLAATGAKIGTVSFPLVLLNSQQELNFGIGFSTGLTIVTTGACDITVVYG